MTAVLIVVTGTIMYQYAYGEVWIPDNELTSYFDYYDIFTVVGAVKNSEENSIVPTVEIRIQDGDAVISESYVLPATNPSKDIPFKIKFPQVTGKNPVLKKPTVTFVPVTMEPTEIEVIYDNTLIKHPDGHTSGFIINNGTSPAYDVKVYALIHGTGNKLIDVGKSIENIEKIEPSQKKEFSIYPDPLFASQVSFYSCFVIGDDTIIPVSVLRGDKKFNFRYDSSAYFNNVKFDNEKNTLELFATNPWPTLVYTNFEFPRESKTQKFQIYLDGKEINPVQSQDEDGNWHLAFNLEPQTSNQILISGFVSEDKSEEQSGNEPYYLFGVIPAAVIAGVFIIKKKKRL